MSKTMFVTVRQDRNGNLTAKFAKKKGRSPEYPLSFSRYRALVNGSGHHMADDDEFAILLFPKEKRAPVAVCTCPPDWVGHQIGCKRGIQLCEERKI